MADDLDGKRYDPKKIAACVDECREHNAQTVKHMDTINGIKLELRSANFDKFGARVQAMLNSLDEQQRRVLTEFAAVVETWGDFGRDAGRLSQEYESNADAIGRRMPDAGLRGAISPTPPPSA